MLQVLEHVLLILTSLQGREVFDEACSRLGHLVQHLLGLLLHGSFLRVFKSRLIDLLGTPLSLLLEFLQMLSIVRVVR